MARPSDCGFPAPTLRRHPGCAAAPAAATLPSMSRSVPIRHGRRRHPARRHDATPARARRERRPGPRRVLRRSSRSAAAFSASTVSRSQATGSLAPCVEPDWAEKRRPDRSHGRSRADERIVAVGNYVRLRDPHTAEAAFAVADDYQRKGIGTRLLEQLARRAPTQRHRGVHRRGAAREPGHALRLRERRLPHHPHTRRRRRRGAVPDRADRGLPGARRRARPRRRDRVAETVLRAEDRRRRRRLGARAARSAASCSATFSPVASPVPRTRSTARASPSPACAPTATLEEIADPIDLCVICLPGDRVIEAAEAALRTGTRALCVISAGFAETGPEGIDRQEQLLDLVRAHGARLVGPNCLGIATAAVGLNATFAPRAFPTGRIGFSSQSGRLGLALLERAEARGSACRRSSRSATRPTSRPTTCSSGGRTTPAPISYCCTSSRSATPASSPRIARRLAREKPVLAMKSGRSHAGAEGRRVTHGRAGRLGHRRRRRLPPSGSDPSRHARRAPRHRRAALEPARPQGQAGRSAHECRRARDPLRRRLRGEPASSLPQLGEETRAALAAALPAEASVANPVDMLGSATAENFDTALPLILADPGIDAVIALFVPPVGRRGRRRRRRDQPRDGRGRPAGQARARRHPRRHGRAGDAALCRHHPVVLVSGGCRERARPRRRARRMAPPLRRHGPSAHGHRQCNGDGGRCGCARPRRRDMARSDRDAPAAHGLRDPDRRRGARHDARGGGRRRPNELGYPVVVKTAAGRCAQDGDRRRRARSRQRRRRVVARPSASVCPSSCSR